MPQWRAPLFTSFPIATLLRLCGTHDQVWALCLRRLPPLPRALDPAPQFHSHAACPNSAQQPHTGTLLILCLGKVMALAKVLSDKQGGQVGKRHAMAHDSCLHLCECLFSQHI